VNGGLNRTASIAPVAVCWNDRQSHALLTTGKEAFALGTLACKLTPMEHRHPIYHPRSDRTRTMVRGIHPAGVEKAGKAMTGPRERRNCMPIP
jgi:hypothetical protein